jgi:hypothetical protein
MDDPYLRGTIRGAMARNFGSWHPGICQFVLCDGSVRGLIVSTPTDTLRKLAVRADGEATGDF